MGADPETACDTLDRWEFAKRVGANRQRHLNRLNSAVWQYDTCSATEDAARSVAVSACAHLCRRDGIGDGIGHRT